MRPHHARWTLCLLFACVEGPGGADSKDLTLDTEVHTPEQPVDPFAEAPESLDALRLLTRISLDLRGRRPDLAELESVSADPTQINTLIEAYLAEPGFEARLVDLYSEHYRTRDDDPFVRFDYWRGTISKERIMASSGEEPLRMLARIAAEGLPYTTLMTADWTMADRTLGSIYPVTYPEGELGWHKVSWTDGRPHAGVLASNGLWWQHGSMENNLNRGRANQIMRIFLCSDLLESEIEFPVDHPIDSPENLGSAIRTDPQCAACHDVLDPIGSNLFGFWYPAAWKSDPTIITRYRPDHELIWRNYESLPPGFMREPTSGLEELAAKVARSEKFSSCLVETTFELLARRPVAPGEQAAINLYVQRFRDGGLQIKSLLRDLMASPFYRSARDERMVSPSLLSSQLRMLTGYRSDDDGWNTLHAPKYGLHAVAGGVDEVERRTLMRTPTATLAMVVDHVAEAASTWAVDQPESAVSALISPEDLLLTEPAEVAAKIAWLHGVVLSRLVGPDDREVREELALWTEIDAATGDAAEAWKTILYLLFRDPRFLLF